MERSDLLKQSRKLFEQGNKNAALKILNRILSSDANNLEALCLMAQVYHSLNKWTKAKETAQTVSYTHLTLPTN